MLRCVHYLQTVRLEEGGVVRAVLDLCRIMAARGHAVTLVTSDAIDVPPAWVASGQSRLPRVVVIDEPSRLNRLTPAALAIAEQTLKQATVLHLHGPWEFSNRQWAGLARRRDIPYVVTVHGMLDDWPMTQRGLKKKLYLMLGGRHYLERAAAVQCTAEMEVAQASKRAGKAKLVSIPYLFDLSPFEKLPGPDLARRAFPSAAGDEPKILFLSRLHEKKGADLLLKAVASITLDPPPTILFAGTGEDDYIAFLKRLAGDLHLSHRAHFLGLVKGDVKLSLYQAADVFVLPTSQENFGLVLPEALACGTPIVTTRGVDIWKEMEAAGGVIVDRSVPQLANAIAGLLADRAALKDRGARGRQWVFANLQEDHLAQQYESLYRDVSHGPQSDH